jgi:hypothetical protein
MKLGGGFWSQNSWMFPGTRGTPVAVSCTNWGIKQKPAYKEWTKAEQQRLIDLVTSMPVGEAACRRLQLNGVVFAWPARGIVLTEDVEIASQ